MNQVTDNFEDEFTQVFSTETLVGSGVRLVGLSLRDVECGDGSMAENGRMSPEVVLQLVRGSEDFLAEHLPWVRGVTAPEIAKRMRSWIFAEQYGQGGCWGVFPTECGCGNLASCENPQAGVLAGFIMAEFNLKNCSATLSYWLSQKFTGRGLMTDALKTLSRFCFDVLKLNRLELSVSVTNEKSSAVATRAGFVEEGINRDFERINGIFVDHRRFSLLVRDLLP
ncbi:MAG: GNAT family N-acetyltransferase [Fibrobacter sp.]|nr:GNAT family N-acetyltransferase [Fibrobacter sp.]